MADYEGYAEVCELLGLDHAPYDIIENSNHKIMKELATRLIALEKRQDPNEHNSD